MTKDDKAFLSNMRMRLSSGDVLPIDLTFQQLFYPDVPPLPAQYELPEIKTVKRNGPATIVFWRDGTKTTAVCEESDTYNTETGLLINIAKKIYGNQGYRKLMEEHCWNQK